MPQDKLHSEIVEHLGASGGFLKKNKFDSMPYLKVNLSNPFIMYSPSFRQ